MIDFTHKRPIIIAGPCSAESEEQLLKTTEEIVNGGQVNIIRAGIWKPRTKPGAFEGIGEVGLKWIQKAKELYKIPFATEVASAGHVELAMKYGIDVLWVGARTTVSPFAVQDIANSLKHFPNVKIFIKNPINPDLDLWTGSVQRILGSGIKPENVGLIHRGFSSYGQNKYRNRPIWSIALQMRQRFPEMPMICDPSHISGDRQYIQELSQIAANLKFDGLMIESHIDPDNALSDAKQQVLPCNLNSILESIQWREETTTDQYFIDTLKEYRSEIDEIDESLLTLLSRRMLLSDKIGEIKKNNNVAILQQTRWSDIVKIATEKAEELGLSKEFISEILESIHIESIRHQNNILSD